MTHHSPFNVDLALRPCIEHRQCGRYVYVANGEPPLCPFHEQVGRVRTLRWAAYAIVIALGTAAFACYNIVRGGIVP